MTITSFSCSRCGFYFGAALVEPIYQCPNCGARFDPQEVDNIVKASRRFFIVFGAVVGGGCLGLTLHHIVVRIISYPETGVYWFDGLLGIISMVGVGIGIYKYFKEKDGII